MSDDAQYPCYGGPRDGDTYPLTESGTVTLVRRETPPYRLVTLGVYRFDAEQQRYAWDSSARTEQPLPYPPL